MESPHPSSPSILLAGTTPEAHAAPLADTRYDHVIFLDAVDCGAAPGSVVWLDASEIAAHFPQVSTHKLSLGLLAKWIQSNGCTQVWLLGVQPQSLQWGAGLSAPVQTTVDLLVTLLTSTLNGLAPAAVETECTPIHSPSYLTA